MTSEVPFPAAGWAPATFLGSLSPAAAAELVALAVRKRFGAGQIILREGAAAGHVVLLLSGFTKVATAVEGFETLLGIRLPGEVVGETGALTGEPRMATVTACGPVTAGLVGRAAFQDFLRRRPETATLVTAAVARRLRRSDRRLAEFAVFPAHIRLARLLSEIAEVCAVPHPDGSLELAVPLSQPELAAMIGIAQATVQKAVGELRDRGLVRTGYRRVRVLDPLGLRRLGDGETRTGEHESR
ncbi:Crp/Fnr family transcriptional regulator [Actinoplanes sp. TFC3]|uniref:Crp/Fnr family transcriptional regulator n=1 Tax=Actinoplanes sp. TFC3 TaxID=1710355 RepID=UPI0008318678|nr:Crp/Fnr family transcriptional regulator [Actinoplanes sp. TFC3]